MRNLIVFLGILALSLTLYSCQPAGPQDAVTEEAAGAMADKSMELWNTQNADLAGELYTEDFTRITPDQTQNGVEELMAAISDAHTTYPDFNVTRGDELVLDGNHLVVTWTASGTNTGPLDDEMPATGKSVSVDGVAVLTLTDDGKVSQERTFFDLLGLYQQLGFTLQPPQMTSTEDEGMGEEDDGEEESGQE
jgi:steroid delta-isomerase-like uncharacterized protein